jgi:hypothetical protein
MRPCTPHQIIRQAIYAFAAVAPQYGKMISLIATLGQYRYDEHICFRMFQKNFPMSSL